MADAYAPTYCTRCAQLQFRAQIGKCCEFCGWLEFAPVRPKPTWTRVDRHVLRQFEIPADKERGRK